MKKVNVSYLGGDSRCQPGTSIDYMLAEIDDIELYAELKNETWNDETQSFDDEAATYDELKEQILEQAAEAGIDAKRLHFWYDKQIRLPWAVEMVDCKNGIIELGYDVRYYETEAEAMKEFDREVDRAKNENERRGRYDIEKCGVVLWKLYNPEIEDFSDAYQTEKHFIPGDNDVEYEDKTESEKDENMKTKFYHESVGECVNQVYEVNAQSWDDAKKITFDDMKVGDRLVECPPSAVKQDTQYSEYAYIDDDMCVKYAKLGHGVWAQKEPSGQEYWEENVYYFDDQPEEYLDSNGEMFTDWVTDKTEAEADEK